MATTTDSTSEVTTITETTSRSSAAMASGSRSASNASASASSSSRLPVSTVYYTDHYGHGSGSYRYYGDDGLSTAAIAGIVVSSVLGATLVAIIGVWYWRRRRRRSAHRQGMWGGRGKPRAIDEESINPHDIKGTLVEPFDSSAGLNEDAAPELAASSSASGSGSRSQPSTSGVVSAKFAQFAKKSAKRNKGDDRGAVTDRAVDGGGLTSPGGQLPPAYDPVWEEERRNSEAAFEEERQQLTADDTR